MQSQILYIEPGGGLGCLEATIGRVEISQTGKTLRYGGRCFQSLRGTGYKTNYVDVETREPYWISRPRHDGRDALYNVTVRIDEDVRVAYWVEIRQQPDQLTVSTFRSPGKYSGKKWRRCKLPS